MKNSGTFEIWQRNVCSIPAAGCLAFFQLLRHAHARTLMPYSLLLLSSCNLLSVRLQATLFLVYTFMVSVGWGAWTIGREVDGLSMEIATE